MFHSLISSFPIVSVLVNSLTAAAANANQGPLVDFQVTNPPVVPENAKQCTVHLLTRTFGNSFGDPEVVQYTPPTDCGTPGSWAAVTLNWTATSNGTQFDRLATISFHNVEIWRTSTPEPTLNGIIWTYIKDVTRYIPLFATPGTLILDLGNLLETGLNGLYDVNLDATFFESSSAHPAAPKSNVVIPISNLSPNMSNVVSVPSAFSLNITFPTNTIEAYAELYASGNSNEEFWYTNVANEFLNDLPSGTTFGDGPFREVRLFVDDMLAGVAFPYAVFFTGAEVPQAWRPITSFGALDLPTYFIDLTPFASVLANGNPHNITLDVVSAESDHAINQNWFVSGNIQVVTDSSNKPTTGKIITHDAPPFAVTSTTGTLSPNGDLSVTVKASRQLKIEGQVQSGSGKVTTAVWQQDLSYTNLQLYLQNTSVTVVEQTSSGSTLSTHNGATVVKENFNFPVVLNTSVTLNSAETIETATAIFDHSYNRQIDPNPFTIGSTIDNHQIASGSLLFFINGTEGALPGSNNNTFSYVDVRGNTFTRQVAADNNQILFDIQGGTLKSESTPVSEPSDANLGIGPLGALARRPGGKQFRPGQGF